jgi:hypothetical protein
LKEENERLKQKPKRAQILEVQHVDATRPDLSLHILENRSKILVLRNPRWVLPIESSNKKEKTLCLLLSKVRFDHYFDCSKFPSQKVEVEGGISFIELRKVKACIYVNDFNVHSNEKLKQYILSLLKPVLGSLVSGGDEDLLVWLDERHKIDEEGFRTDPRNYVYDNFYLYYGSLGSGTMLHFDTLDMPAINVVLNGKKKWIFVGGGEVREKLEMLLGRDLIRDTQFVHPKMLREMGVEFKEVIVEAGQAVFVPSGVLHCVLNLDPDTVAVAWNVMLPEHVLGALEAFQWSRVVGPGLNESENSKVRFQELIFRIRYHSTVQTPIFLELERSLGEERTKELILAVQTVFDEIVRLEHLDWKPLAAIGSNFGDHFKCDRCLAPIWNRAFSSRLGDRCPDCFRRFGGLPNDDSVTIYHCCDPTELRKVLEKIQVTPNQLV